MKALRLVSSQPATDGALCRAFLAGDAEAFGELVRRHQASVISVVRRFTPTQADTFDVSQRAFLQAFEAARRAMPRLQKQGGGDVPFRAWVLRIAINLAKNQARDARRWRRTGVETLVEVPANAASAQQKLERSEDEARVREAVLSLPRRQREVFALRVDAGLPFADIAQTLGITEGNAKTHFHYAVRRLRDDVRAASGEP